MGIKKISLTDNSFFKCNRNNLQLIYLRTMTRGSPFYSKYLFTPVYEDDKKAFNYNKQLFLKNPTISKDIIISMIKKLDLDEKNDNHKHIIKYIKNIFIPSLTDKNLVKDIIKKLIDDSINLKDICNILYNIYEVIYFHIGYKKYREKAFELYLDDFKITIKK